MKKIGFLFPGQGAQYIGMGRELAENIAVCRETFHKASEVLGYDIEKLCFEGPKEELDRTENTQPAILTTSIAVLRAVEERGIKPSIVAGLSLGEYTALVCSGVLSFEEAVTLVRKRGEFMQEAVPEGVGTMAAILGISKEEVEAACAEAKIAGIVEPANFNCPEQIVIGGEIEAVKLACEKAAARGAKRTMMLSVSGPFHTSMLKPAAEKLQKELEKITLADMKIPVLTNVSGSYIEKTEDIKGLLKKQVMSSVLWEDTIRKMIQEGVEAFVEIGPGKVLSGFVRKVDRKITVVNIEDMRSLEKAIEVLGG